VSGTLEICKDSGSSEGTFQFSVPTGSNPSPSQFSLMPGECQDVTFGQGSYRISEDNGGITNGVLHRSLAIVN
jgi:hypothetical protein